jgi:hypothetical protein
MVARGLAVGGGVLVVVLVTLTVLAFRPAPQMPPSTLLAIRVGLVTLLGSLAAGAVMIAVGMVRVMRGEAAAVYANGGWLKPTHAVLLHALTVLPLLAWLARYAGWDERGRWLVTVLGCVGYAVAAAVVSTANVLGGDPRTMPVAALALAAAGAAALLTAGTLVLVRLSAW